MNGKLLLDTNVILGLLKGETSITALLETAATDVLCASVITRMELLCFPGITPEENRNPPVPQATPEERE